MQRGFHAGGKMKDQMQIAAFKCDLLAIGRYRPMDFDVFTYTNTLHLLFFLFVVRGRYYVLDLQVKFAQYSIDKRCRS